MITINAEKIKEVEEDLGKFKKRAPSIIARALNRTAENARANSVRQVREEYHTKAKEIRDTINIVKASKDSLGALVESKGKMVPLDKFKINPTKANPKKPPKVLKAAVKKDGLKDVLGAFIANINGNKVFKRSTDKRLPIKKLFGPAVPIMIGNKDIREYIESEAVKTFDKRLNHEIQRALDGGKK